MAECGAIITGAPECGSTLQYVPGVIYICTQPTGHEGAHFADGGPMAWTCTHAAIAPRDLTRPG